MNKFKRFIPILCLVTILVAYLIGQFAFKHGDSNANFTTREKKINSHFESMFKKSIFTTTDGTSINLNDDKTPIVIINFWASWCKPCLEEFSSLVKLRNKYKPDQLKIIAVNTDVEKQAMEIKKTVKKYNLNFTVVPDKDGKIINDYMVEAIPVSIIYNRGKVYQVSKGQHDFYSEEVFDNFDKLLK